MKPWGQRGALWVALVVALMAGACGPQTAKTATGSPASPAGQDQGVANPLGNTAQACRIDSDCAPPDSCVDGACLPICREDRDCPDGATCGADQYGAAACLSPAVIDSNTPCTDEVACLLADTPPACCEKYNKKGGGSSAAPTALTREAIKNAMAGIRQGVVQCGKDHPGAGTVKIKVTVAPSGIASRVEVLQSPSADLGACVASLARDAYYQASDEGGTFTYPFAFD